MAGIALRSFLHVGCGPVRINPATQLADRVKGFDVSVSQELRLDMNPDVALDVLGTVTDMAAVAAGSVDAIDSSHNIEHLYSHEVPMALAEFKRVLGPKGFLVITCPDLQSVCALVADDKLTEATYVSEAGSIAPLNILYGLRPAMASGNLFISHRCGFTLKVLLGVLQEAGFLKVLGWRRSAQFDLWAVACL
jgi:ubiquinone/menaquinone biosynthesis C-methylase UbiE